MAKKIKFSGEVLHFAGVRLRVKGSGNLKLTLDSLDSINSEDLSDISLQASTNVEPTQLSNLVDQSARLIIKTTEINETFYLSKLIIFIKPMASEYPR